MKDLLVILEEIGKEDPPMMTTEGAPKEEREALHMKIEDIGRDLTQEIGGTTMALADLGGEGTAGRVSTSRGLLLQAPLLPRDQCC